MTLRIDRVGDTVDLLGECPLWDERHGRLYWIDSMAALVHHLHPASGRREAFGRLEADGAVTCLDSDIDAANGPCFSPDGRTLYLADSRRRRIWAYDYPASGAPTGRRLFVDTTAYGSPLDGATIDAEGFVWSALVLAGAIARFSPDGRLDRMIAMPVTRPTSVAFGGPDLKTLYATSISRSPRLHCSAPDAGGLFAIDGLGVQSLPAFKAVVSPAA
jgi:L-arabinonolactonase